MSLDIGTWIGPYKLLNKIGEGSVGVIFSAAQEMPVRRTVAVKFLKPGMDLQIVARFEAERQALAIMDHPNIVRMLDGGTHDERPYFVMELITGMPITEYCDRHCLALWQRLRLFGQLCQAVQHAHRKGIVHRGLKPADVLVTMDGSTPIVKLIDFGIAKAMALPVIGATVVFTGFLPILGTPMYTSPEQAGGLDVDTRSDIYSLGALLYELLTGTTPFEKERFRTAGPEETRRIIREEEPPKPSTRLSTTNALSVIAVKCGLEPQKLIELMVGELDRIVMKCLEKDRCRRFGTVGELVKEIERYVDSP